MWRGGFKAIAEKGPGLITEESHAVTIDAEYPEQLSRLSTALRVLFFILGFLSLAVFVAVVIAWFCDYDHGRYPRGLHGFVVGNIRWLLRVQAYILSLPDKYPPFRLGLA